MQGMMYLAGKDQPVAVFDEVKIVEMNDNHNSSPLRITYKSKELNASKLMIELYREQQMRLRLNDGRECDVLLQHSSLDMEGHAVGVLRVMGEIEEA